MPRLHVADVSRTRGRGAPGGWRWLPTCSCGWRAGGSIFGRSYVKESEAWAEVKIHLDASLDRNKRRIIMRRAQPDLRSRR